MSIILGIMYLLLSGLISPFSRKYDSMRILVDGVFTPMSKVSNILFIAIMVLTSGITIVTTTFIPYCSVVLNGIVHHFLRGRAGDNNDNGGIVDGLLSCWQSYLAR
jgi:cytochrome c biogenesis factor